MKRRIFENDILKRVFREAYFAREKPSPNTHWQQQVMSRVRKIGPLAPTQGFWPSLERLVWRLAPVNVALILLLVFLNLKIDPGYDYLGNSAADLDRPGFSESIGLEGS